MSEAPRKRTSYLLVAIVALTLFLSGGAAAVAAPLTEKAVKKIAKAQVKKLAPKLSVAKAKDADALGGAPASAYLQKSGVRADGVASSSDIAITFGPFATILSKVLNAPQDGYVFIVGTLSANKTSTTGGNSIVEFQIAMDGTPLTTDTGYHQMHLSDSAYVGTGAVSAVVAVPAGAHTFTLLARDQGAGGSVRGRDLSILYTPSGSAPVLPY